VRPGTKSLGRTAMLDYLRDNLRVIDEQLSHRGAATPPLITADPARHAARLLGAYAAVSPKGAPLIAPVGPAPIDVVDVFSGCGGMSMGFGIVSRLLPSYRLAGAVDIDRAANKTFARNLGVTPFHADIREIEGNESKFRDFRASADLTPDRPLVLIGCAPCQGFSSYRKDGMGDTRNSLMNVFARLAVRLQPRVLIMENVPELLSQRYWPFFLAAKQTLEEAGYVVRARVYNLAEFGVPQERFRAVVFAMRRSFTMPEGFLRRADFRTVRHAISYLPTLVPGGAIPDLPMHVTANHRASTIDTIRQVPKDGGNRTFDIGPESLRRAYQRQGKKAFEDVYGRLRWDRPSITITHYSRNPASGRFAHPEQDRGLSALEAALLQGFPDDYYFEGTFDEKFSQIGNAVPPVFAAYLAAHALGEILSAEAPVERPEDDVREPLGSSFSRMIGGLKKESA